MYIQGKYLLGGQSDISECMAIRREVFGEEQHFFAAAQEDEEDRSAIFALVYETGSDGQTPFAVGTARLVFLGERFRIGRVAVKKEFRGRKYGDFLVRMLIDKAVLMGATEVYVGAQESAVPFYETIGFLPTPECYVEDGVRHQVMRLDVKACGHPCESR